ncbi:hypothetical protein U4959_02285 [Acinetobacter junii]|mgnify:FL=1|jgi:hypothetical protein|uniref:Lipoprotein n=2 Tax=Acinetobacter junii TaxID=40215 RepID=A0ABU8ZE22_ACIJU|nr:MULTISPECIES: hypothetical protein [Acinetobacter]AWA48975.1 hypothetical protein CDG57_13925 [Acinetobacter junii]ENV49236.1 hypothetical protein F953_03418 [Acinetobacter junii CIP 107470 = MTCC 11364]EPR87045.1 hypothetical protein L292_1907 [Acinetobacter junii CIP 107470 = MTCC 11364]MBL8282405.1 hypothetical protein [Acinetobacter junii]MDH0717714.1 hypothetical protein [Acinetobacter junii]
MQYYKVWILAVFILLQACTTPNWRSVQLQDYLQPYIGQPASNIQQNLNLRELGFQTLKAPKKTDEYLIFTVLRPINIPVPMTQSIGEIGPTMTGTRLGSITTSQQSYDVNFYCHIIFELDQQQIARSIRYEGKAC